MAAEVLRVREELAAGGELDRGYHPRMRAVHEQNAARMHEILAADAWPTKSLVGEEAAAAAWLVVQHAIGDPPLQRRCLALLGPAVEAGEVPAVQAAMLEDRIRTQEGRGQLYGTQFDWDAEGRMSALPIDDAAHVDDRRHAIGLPPIAEAIAAQRAAVAARGATPPADWDAYQRERNAWLRSAGWRS